MEHLLALSIDNLSSRSISKIRKGLRQTEGLLAQICLSNHFGTSPTKSPRTPSGSQEAQTPLESLLGDPAYLEFFRLQQTFEYNIASKILSTLSLLLATQQTAETQTLTIAALETLHGILIIHPPSRNLLCGQAQMSLLLELFNPTQFPAQTIIAAVLVLLTTLIDRPSNARTFEAVDGLAHITALLNTKDVQIHHAAEDFLAFYLLPEEPDPSLSVMPISRQPSFDANMGGVALPVTPSAGMPSSTLATGMDPPSTPSRHQRSPSKIVVRDPSEETPTKATPSRSRQMHSRSPSKATMKSDGSGRSWRSQGSGRLTKTSAEKRVLLSAYVRDLTQLTGYG